MKIKAKKVSRVGAGETEKDIRDGLERFAVTVPEIAYFRINVYAKSKADAKNVALEALCSGEDTEEYRISIGGFEDDKAEVVKIER